MIESIRAAGIVARNLIIGANLRSLALLTEPRRLAAYVSETLFFYKTFTDTRGLEQRNPFEVLPGSQDLAIELPALGRGSFSYFGTTATFTADLIGLCLITRLVLPKMVFEIGTFDGYTALHLAANAPDSIVYTLDLPKGAVEADTALPTTLVDREIMAERSSRPTYCFEGRPEEARIRCLHGDSATFDFEPYSSAVDLFFIDGSHSYEYVRSDTHNALRCCHPGSVIVWHDYGRVGLNGITRWLDEFASDHKVWVIPGGSLAFCEVP